MAVRSKRPTDVRGKTPQRGHKTRRQPNTPVRAVAAIQSTTTPTTKPQALPRRTWERVVQSTTTKRQHYHAERGSEPVRGSEPPPTKTAAEAAVFYPVMRQALPRRAWERAVNLSVYSHSIVAGGLLDTSYVTRETCSISLIIRFDTFSSRSYGRCAQRAVIKSMVSTARSAITHS